MKEFFKKLFKQDDVSIAIAKRKEEYRTLAKEHSAGIKNIAAEEEAIEKASKTPRVAKPELEFSYVEKILMRAIEQDSKARNK